MVVYNSYNTIVEIFTIGLSIITYVDSTNQYIWNVQTRDTFNRFILHFCTLIHSQLQSRKGI